jgi:hypothetical protein
MRLHADSALLNRLGYLSQYMLSFIFHFGIMYGLSKIFSKSLGKSCLS